MRLLILAGACAGAGVLAVLQGFGTIALRDRAVRPAFATFVPLGWERRVERLAGTLPLPDALRLVLARNAVARGDTMTALGLVDTLPSATDRFALQAAVARRQGDEAAAQRFALLAGDEAAVEGAVGRLEAAGRVIEARNLAEAIVRRLTGDPSQVDALAQATYELGITRQACAEVARSRDERRRLAFAALAAYRRATELAPLSLRYLLALGNQYLNLGNDASARSTFLRARDLDPTSAEPWTGLGELALRAGDRRSAVAMLAQARALAPQAAAVVRFAAELRR